MVLAFKVQQPAQDDCRDIESSEDLSQMVVDKPRVDTPRYVSSPNVASVTQYAVGTQERDP